jgi:hypothetical protein
MDYSSAREFAETFRASTPIHGSRATFSQTPCFLPSLALRVPRKAFLSLKTLVISGRITPQPSSRGKKTSAARGLGSPIATANVSDGCGDFICSVARAHFGRAVCRSFRFFFRIASATDNANLAKFAVRRLTFPAMSSNHPLVPERRQFSSARIQIR